MKKIKMVLVGCHCAYLNSNLCKSELCHTVCVWYGQELDAFTQDMKHFVSCNHHLAGLIMVKIRSQLEEL